MPVLIEPSAKPNEENCVYLILQSERGHCADFSDYVELAEKLNYYTNLKKPLEGTKTPKNMQVKIDADEATKKSEVYIAFNCLKPPVKYMALSILLLDFKEPNPDLIRGMNKVNFFKKKDLTGLQPGIVKEALKWLKMLSPLYENTQLQEQILSSNEIYQSHKKAMKRSQNRDLPSYDEEGLKDINEDDENLNTKP